jgi:HSP20 family molecular chaperone IbpA
MEVDANEAKATFKNGVLTIKLPKVEKVRTKRLDVDED